MARNDGIDRTSVRNLAVSDKAVGNTQQHNEREKDSYRNPDIIPQRAAWNVHFKKPTASYTDLFAQLEAAGTISTRGLKPDATHYCELVFDVNSAYFDNHGGYEFAKQFYEDAYQAAVQIVGGEQYILSAVMHADEINRAMTEALGREVYHYHLHVVYDKASEFCAVHGSLRCCTRRKRKIRTLLQSETGSDFSCLVGAGGFEPPKLKAADLQSVPIGHSGTRPYSFVAHPYAGRLVYFSMRREICQLSFLLFFSKFKQHPTKAGKDAMTGGFYGNRALLWCNCRKEKAKII